MLTDYYKVSGSTPDWSRIDLYGYPFTNNEISFSIESGADFRSFRELWKSSYRELSQLIRESRTAFRQRHRSEEGMDHWRSCWPALKGYCVKNDLDAPTLGIDSIVWQLRAHARFMMNLLEQAKKARPTPV